MHLGIRLLFGVFLILGLATFFVLRVFVTEIKPSVRDVLEEVMIDSANAFAEMAAPELADGTIANAKFAAAMKSYNARQPDAKVSGLTKKSVDFRVYVTDAQGIVRYDSENIAVGQDYSRWRDVSLTLRGEYGARATRDAERDDGTSVFYVAAPIVHQGQRIGVLTLAKNSSTVGPFIERAENKILSSGALLIGLSLLIGVAATLWIVHAVRKLVRYAEEVEAGQRLPPPELPGELGKLARAMNGMRDRLEGKRYVESTVRALTHEIKSPLAAIRGAGELLREPMPIADQTRFAQNVVEQSERMQRTVDRLLDLSKLEGLSTPINADAFELVSLVQQVIANAKSRHTGMVIELNADPSVEICGDHEQIELALTNLIENAIAFSSPGAKIQCNISRMNQVACIDVIDTGPGFADFAAEKIGERFVSSPRPDGSPKSSGLGLAIAKQVAELHGGTLMLISARQPTQVRLTLKG
ncbi:MAG: two-component system sensor histidine kinase CreC [Betaproteobacteria bacterium]|nr:MAG: two-component system sensor histidine kinase CreC [Betaproteobacteria bacterium]